MSSFLLKIIAIISMTIDHAARIIGQHGLMELFHISLSTSYRVIQIMGIFGRMAFPIFAFLIAEGTRKTRSMPKYIGRLALFAVISEPIFYFGNNIRNEVGLMDFINHLLGLNFSNVFFTLMLGASAIYAYQLLENKPKKMRYWYIPILIFIVLVGGYIGCDYGVAGIILIVALYFAQKKPQKVAVILIWSIALYIISQGVGNWSQAWDIPIANCIFATLSSVLICLNNGKRGKPLKWLFYIYYPAHILVLSCLSSIIT